jgi:predicted AAA+ superfamily ATPase
LQIDGADVIFTGMTHYTRLLSPPSGSFFLFGPRGTGKSTWLHATFPDSVYIDLLDSVAYRQYAARPERVEELVRAMSGSSVCIIDEIQRVPGVLPVVHRLIEAYPDIRFVLTGSSARKLRRAGVDLLAGRAVLTTMHPFMAAELGTDFSLSSALACGMIPLVVSARDQTDVLHGYISLYIEQEVRAEGLVRNIEDFSRFLEVISFSQGSLLNLSEIARECEVKRTTVNGYMSILEDLLIAHQVPVFSRRAKRGLVKHRKFFLCDCGVFTSLRPSGPMDKGGDIQGPALEGLVYQHLYAWLAYSRSRRGELYFWRTKNGVEVDFVVYGECGFWAIEVKNSDRIRRKDCRPLMAFCEDYPEAVPLLLYRGRETRMIGPVLGMPVDTFLARILPDRPLPGTETRSGEQ